MGTRARDDDAENEQRRARRLGFPVLLGALLAAGLLLRILYLLAQPGADPFFDRPFLDGELYVRWAEDLVAGRAEEGEAFYLAPLYPHVLAALFSAVGERLSLVYLLQHLLSVASAGGIGWIAWRRYGAAAGIASAALFVFHQPLVFFASTPMGETLALSLLVASLLVGLGRGGPRAAAGGVLGGLACLARPNLLLVPAALVVGELVARRWRRAALITAGTALAVLPVTVRNLVVSGHPVLVSANGGITAFHGNAPGATGTFTRPSWSTGVASQQRDEATARARALTGRTLDHVEADRWWGGQARKARLEDPGGTLGLLAWRAWLVLDDFEHALDYDPMLDENPWRPALRLGADPARPGSGFRMALVPFAGLFGLAMAALALYGGRRSGGWSVWGPVLACVATPILFYVSSRYRLATSALLTLPAGLGLVGLLGLAYPLTRGRRLLGLGVFLAAAALSLLVPSEEHRVQGRSYGLSNRAGILILAGDHAAAEPFARMAVELRPAPSPLYHNLGMILAETGRPDEAIEAYENAVRNDPGNAASAASLADLLLARGRGEDAITILRRTVDARPTHGPCWNRLVFALRGANRPVEAEAAIREAGSHGVRIDPRLGGR